jgi:putative transposase
LPSLKDLASVYVHAMLEYGKYYHIFNRGNNREDLFKEEKNYDYFLKLYIHHIDPVADTFAYCLMKNHFHLLVRIKEKDELERLAKYLKLGKSLDPLQSFKNFFISYSKSINKAYGRTGALFEYPFKKIEINSDLYFSRLVHYIHFNPQHHGFTDDFRTYPYSSYQLILSEQVTTLQRGAVIQWFGGKKDFLGFHTNVSIEKELRRFIGEDEL